MVIFDKQKQESIIRFIDAYKDYIIEGRDYSYFSNKLHFWNHNINRKDIASIIRFIETNKSFIVKYNKKALISHLKTWNYTGD